MGTDDKRRIEKLTGELKIKTRRMEELREEIDEQRDLIQRLREHAEHYVSVIEHWKKAFKMVQNGNGAAEARHRTLPERAKRVVVAEGRA